LNAAPKHHAPIQTRAGLWLALFGGSLAAGIALAAAPWIPEWTAFVDAVLVLLVFVAAAAGVALFLGVRHSVRQRVPAKWRLPVNLLSAALVFGAWGFLVLVAGVAASDFPFGPRYARQFKFPEYDSTVYLYDSSFLDPSTTVFVRQGWLPLRTRVVTLNGNPKDVDVVQHGSLLMLNEQQLDLSERR
jgi:hypothetical protein